MMIRNYVILDETGTYPTGAGANFTVPDGAVEVDWDAFDYQLCMLVDGLWERRPQIAAPSVGSDGVVLISGLPDGTVATVTDVETQAVLATISSVDGSIEFQLPDPATYEIEISAPLPWLPWSGRVTC